MTSAVFAPDYLTVGASGALFGWIAMWLVDIIQDYQYIRYPGAIIAITIVTVLISLGT